jgi:hypothetical protein
MGRFHLICSAAVLHPLWSSPGWLARSSSAELLFAKGMPAPAACFQTCNQVEPQKNGIRQTTYIQGKRIEYMHSLDRITWLPHKLTALLFNSVNYVVIGNQHTFPLTERACLAFNQAAWRAFLKQPEHINFNCAHVLFLWQFPTSFPGSPF